jgi:hypothetical protein
MKCFDCDKMDVVKKNDGDRITVNCWMSLCFFDGIYLMGDALYDNRFVGNLLFIIFYVFFILVDEFLHDYDYDYALFSYSILI